MEEVIAVEKGKIDKDSVLNTVSLAPKPQKANDPFTDVEAEIRRKPNAFAENLRRVLETQHIGDGKPVNEQASSLTEGDDNRFEELTSSEPQYQASDFPSPPNTRDRASIPDRHAYVPVLYPPTASTEQLAIPNITTVAKDSSSPNQMPVQILEVLATTNIMSTPKKLTNFAAECSAKETRSQTFKFELPEELTRSAADSSIVDVEEKAVPWYEFAPGRQVSFVSGPRLPQPLDPLPSPATLGHIRERPEPKLPVSGISLGGEGDMPLRDAAGKELLPTLDSEPATSLPSAPLSTGISSKESPPSPNPPIKSSPQSPVPLMDASILENPVVVNPPSISCAPPETPALPEIPDQKPLPEVDFGFRPRNSNISPRLRSPPSTDTKAPVVSFASSSGFSFGSQCKPAPKAFDFDKWSKLSSAARLSGTLFSWNGLDSESGLNLDGKDVAAEVEESKTVPSEDSSQNAEADSTQGPLVIETTSSTSLNESIVRKEETENVSESPRTPITIKADTKGGLLTPEATPDSTEPPHVIEDIKVSELDPNLIEQQEKLPSTLAPEEHETIGTEAPPEPTNDLVQRSEARFGDALIHSESRYKTQLPSDHADGLFTPPESPPTSRRLIPSAESCLETHTESATYSLADVPRARLPAVVPRKPLPSPRQVEPSQHKATVCEGCGRSLGAAAEGCHCHIQEEIEWENQGASAATRVGLRRRFRRGAAKKVTAMKTKVVKVADSIVTRLEPAEDEI